MDDSCFSHKQTARLTRASGGTVTEVTKSAFRSVVNSKHFMAVMLMHLYDMWGKTEERLFPRWLRYSLKDVIRLSVRTVHQQSTPGEQYRPECWTPSEGLQCLCYAVRESLNSVHHHHLRPNEGISFGWTVFIPPEEFRDYTSQCTFCFFL